MIFISNKLADHLFFHFGTSYEKTSIDSCLNNPKLLASNNILIGTSVSRELINANLELHWQNEDYFVCAMSAPTTNISFHFLLLNLLSESVDLSERTVLVELTEQSLRSKNPTFIQEQFRILFPLDTKLYSITSVFHHPELLSGAFPYFTELYGLILQFVFPFEKLKLINFHTQSAYSPRQNYYLNQKHTASLLNQEQLKMFNSDFNKNAFSQDFSRLRNYAKRNNIKLKFVLPPTNSDYTTLGDSSFNLQEVLLQEGVKSQDMLDLRHFNNPALFADCCHFNELGHSTIEQLLMGDK